MTTGTVSAAVAVSLDGFIAGPDDGPEQALGQDGDRLFTWFFNGDTERLYLLPGHLWEAKKPVTH